MITGLGLYGISNDAIYRKNTISIYIYKNVFNEKRSLIFRHQKRDKKNKNVILHIWYTLCSKENENTKTLRSNSAKSQQIFSIFFHWETQLKICRKAVNIKAPMKARTIVRYDTRCATA